MSPRFPFLPACFQKGEITHAKSRREGTCSVRIPSVASTPLEGSIGQLLLKKPMRRAVRRIVATGSSAGILAAFLAAFAPSHRAYSFKRFINPNGDWAVAANWLNGLPTSTDDVMVQFGYTATDTTSGASAGNLSIGGFSDTGNVVVTGAGVLTVSNSLTMYGGSALSVQSGGTFNLTIPSGQGSTIGSTAGTDTFTITGAGSSFSFSGGVLSLAAATSNVTNTTISAGGLLSVSVPTLYGRERGARAISRSPARIRSSPAASSLYVGENRAPTSTMMVNAGGQVSDVSAILGSYASQGAVTVSDAGSSWTTSGSVFIGTPNTNTGGSVLVQNGATGSSGSMSIGVQNGLAATFAITGTGSAWLNTGTFTLAANSLAAVTVSAGGKLTSNGTASLAAGGSGFTITDPWVELDQSGPDVDQ